MRRKRRRRRRGGMAVFNEEKRGFLHPILRDCFEVTHAAPSPA